MASQKQREPGTAVARCPICREPTVAGFRPFCSARCRDVDLSRWLRGNYAIPGGQAEADEDGDDAAVGRTPVRGDRSDHRDDGGDGGDGHE